MLAGSLYLLDSLAGRDATHVWLETGVNMWSAAALGCVLHGIRREQARWLVAAGAFGVLAATTKYTGVALLAALVLALLAYRKWRACGAVLLGAAVCAGVYALLLLPAGWRELVQQTLVAQLLRPGDGLDSAQRFAIAFGGVTSLPTVVAAGLGCCMIMLCRPRFGLGWALVLAWLAAALALIARGPTFYSHYATQLVPALALLGGGMVERWSVGAQSEKAKKRKSEQRITTDNRQRKTGNGQHSFIPRPSSFILFLLVFAPLVATQQFMLPPAPLSRDWVESGRVIRESMPPDAPLLTFEPMYNLLGDRPFARAPDGRLLIDSYMHVRWLGIAWNRASWVDMFNAATRRAPLPSAAEQDATLAMLRAAQYAALNEFRTVQTKEQTVALAGNFRATMLGIGALYSRSPTPRHFQAETIRMRGVLLPTVAKAGAQLPVAMFWQKPLEEARQPFVSLQLVGANDTKIGQYDKPVGPAEAGLQAWPVGPNTYQDDVLLPISPDAPAGEYRLLMVIYEPVTGARWPLTADNGEPLGEVIELERVVIGQG